MFRLWQFIAEISYIVSKTPVVMKCARNDSVLGFLVLDSSGIYVLKKILHSKRQFSSTKGE